MEERGGGWERESSDGRREEKRMIIERVKEKLRRERYEEMYE